ncbi:MAG: DUF4350 domain-containing protein [Myxococcus sp.]|nr:DUF4350 domain-containing protein [Myxococcus sp.]
MNRLGAWPLFALLLLLALALGLAAEGDAQVSSVPSVSNPGPRGLKALFTWLKEGGADVRAGATPLTELPPEIATVVIPAPVAATLTDAERAALRRGLERGATVVLLVARGASTHELADLVTVRGSPAPELSPTPTDGVGSTVSVTSQVGALVGVSALRVASERALRVIDPDAVPLTSPPVLWVRRVGEGALYVAAGADLAENARLDLADNAVLWRNLAARGPMWFDESHHVARASQTPTVNLWATGLQFLFAAALFVASRGARLGPVRAEPPAPLRSSTEYVEAMARLTRRAHLEPELVEALRRQLRLTLHERLGVALALPDGERARLVAQALGWSELDAAALFTDGRFTSLSQRLARLEAQLSGRAAT